MHETGMSQTDLLRAMGFGGRLGSQHVMIRRILGEDTDNPRVTIENLEAIFAALGIRLDGKGAAVGPTLRERAPVIESEMRRQFAAALAKAGEAVGLVVDVTVPESSRDRDPRVRARKTVSRKAKAKGGKR